MSISIVENRDCLEAMEEFPDKFFDLAIVDPPYAINRFKNGENSRLRKYGQMDSVNNARPSKEYFDELFRVSKNQIVWGFNHLCDLLPPTTEFIFWYKHQPLTSYSDGELAWTSFTKTAKCFDYAFAGTIGAEADRIHPTQKPVALYEWILKTYAQKGYKILDTHLGSGSSRIACYNGGYDFWGYEIDKEYFEKQEQRFENHTSQLRMEF
jgi:site-specific DNA-methyltransferase (adenine-specific)